MMSNGYKPAPLDLSDVKLLPPQEILVDKLAENAHNVWAKDRIRQGWTYGIQQVRSAEPGLLEKLGDVIIRHHAIFLWWVLDGKLEVVLALCFCTYIIYRLMGLDSIRNSHTNINSGHNSHFAEKDRPTFLLLVRFTCDCVALCLYPDGCVCSLFLPVFLHALWRERWAFMPPGEGSDTSAYSSAVFLRWSQVSTPESAKEGC